VKREFELNLQKLGKLLHHLRCSRELEEDRMCEHKVTSRAILAHQRELRQLKIQTLDMVRDSWCQKFRPLISLIVASSTGYLVIINHSVFLLVNCNNKGDGVK